jgi:hypothetical protein
MAAALLAAAPAVAVTVGQTSANFGNAVGGTDNGYSNTDGLAGNETFRWGQIVTPGTPQNSFNFASATPGNVTLGSQFTLGTFSYANQPSYGDAVQTVDLSLTALVDGVASPNFLFRFALDQTPNDPPCVYQSATPCADAVTVTALSNTGTFTANGTDYTLFIDGFRDVSGNFSTFFVGDENTITTASVVGRFAPINGSAVPEPASWAMMVGGFGLLGSAMRRRSRASALA